MDDQLSKYASNPEVQKIIKEMLEPKNPVESNLNIICTTMLKTLFLIAAERSDYETSEVFKSLRDSMLTSMRAWIEEGGDVLVCDSISVFRYNLNNNIYQFDDKQLAASFSIYEKMLKDLEIESVEADRYEYQKSIIETLNKKLGLVNSINPPLSSSDESGDSDEDDDNLF